MERIAFGVFLSIRAIRFWGSQEFWSVICYGWLDVYEVPKVIKSSKAQKMRYMAMAASSRAPVYGVGVSFSFTGSLSNSILSIESSSGATVINSLEDKFTIQGYYYFRDLNIKIASSKYPHFLVATLLKCLFNVQWIPGPKP